MSQLHLTLCHFYFQYRQVELEKRGYFSPRSEKKCTMFAKTSQKSGYFSPEFGKKVDTFLEKNRQDLEKSGQFSPLF